MEWSFSFREATYVYCYLSLLIGADVDAVSPCINTVELLERLLIPSGLGNYINATSFVPPHLPSQATTSGIGWCSDDLACSSAERQFIEVDFGAEVIIEAVAILRAGGGYVTHYSVEYARSNRDYHCISDRISNESVNETCSLDAEPSSFANSVTARYVRVIPIQWVGASVCLRMEFYGCTIKECQPFGTHFPIDMVTASSTSSTSNDNQLFDLINPWCASGPAPQIIRLYFNDSVYLTQLRVTGNSANVSVLFDMSEKLYQDTAGFTKFGIFFNTRIIPLWPAVNTTQLGFELNAGITPLINPVCFAVQLTGCLSSHVIDHSISLLSTTSINPDPTISTCTNMVVTPYIISTPACTTTQVAGITTVIITSTVHAATSQSTTLRINTLPTVTVTSTVSATPSQCITILISPSPAQCYNQQVTDDGRNSCNAVAICVPVAMVIAVVVCVIVIFVVWRLRQKVAYNVGTNNLEMVYNDLYGMENPAFSKADKSIYDYPAFLPERYSDQSAASNVVPSSKRTDSAAKSGSTSTVMNTNNPLYVHEETLNSDYVNYK